MLSFLQATAQNAEIPLKPAHVHLNPINVKTHPYHLHISYSFLLQTTAQNVENTYDALDQ